MVTSLLPSVAIAQTSIEISNLRGQAAYRNEGYDIGRDSISAKMTFCYEGDRGKFDNNPGTFMRFGSNTWIWFSASEATEVAEVWTFDFANQKALFARTRGAGALLPATTGAYVGDISPRIGQ